MKAISERLQLWIVAFGYASILLLWAAMAFSRYLAETSDPAAANASSGMWAAGDALLSIFVGFLLLVPTFFLLRVMARHQAVYTLYSKIALAVSLTAPVAVAILVFAYLPETSTIQDLCLLRMLRAPFVIIVLAMSRIMARFETPRRLLMYALSAESLTLLVVISLFLASPRAA